MKADGGRSTIVVAVILALGIGFGVVTALYRLQHENRSEDQAAERSGASASEKASADKKPPVPRPVPGLDDLKPEPPEDSAAALKTAGSVPEKPAISAPEALVTKIGKALEKGDVEAVERLLGNGALTPGQRKQLRELAKQTSLRLRKDGPVREVGELEIGKATRWALEFETPDGKPRQMWLDLRRKDGRWIVERVELPPTGTREGPPPAMLADSLGVADLFVQAVLKQEFDLAHAFVDTKRVSDAKIAGLCILFEEGNYRMRSEKPLRKLFERDGIAAFVAAIEASDGTRAAQFGLTLERSAPKAPWKVTEINLDSLIADYAKRFAGGDIFYTPLIPNPKGGDTLVLYFEFDKDQLNERTVRQLEIVARILKGDTRKRIVVSGYTDALGTEQYNKSLSGRRAARVRDYLAAAGVPAEQIVTEAKGKSNPRRPNFREDGSDNPLGRRANRRSEIYLDF
jgi:outer membrane protein OmpA-like peptidoglycan-associated protein